MAGNATKMAVLCRANTGELKRTDEAEQPKRVPDIEMGSDRPNAMRNNVKLLVETSFGVKPSGVEMEIDPARAMRSILRLQAATRGRAARKKLRASILSIDMLGILEHGRAAQPARGLPTAFPLSLRPRVDEPSSTDMGDAALHLEGV